MGGGGWEGGVHAQKQIVCISMEVKQMITSICTKALKGQLIAGTLSSQQPFDVLGLHHLWLAPAVKDLSAVLHDVFHPPLPLGGDDPAVLTRLSIMDLSVEMEYFITHSHTHSHTHTHTHTHKETKQNTHARARARTHTH